jgi:hypothetical protein
MLLILISIFILTASPAEAIRLRQTASPPIAPCETQDAPSTYGLEDHPIGPIYIEAKRELDRFNIEMAKLGTMDTPNFDTARKSTFDVAFGTRR